MSCTRVLLPLAPALLGLLCACAAIEGERARDLTGEESGVVEAGGVEAGAAWMSRGSDGRSFGSPAPGEPSLEAMYAIGAAAEAITEGRPEEGLLLLAALDEPDPPAIVLFLEGVCHMHLGDLDRARSLLGRAVELQPDDTAALTVLARAEYEAGATESAARHLKHLSTIEPDSAQNLASLGLVSIELGQLDAAYTALRDAVELDATCFDGHRGLGLLFASIGELDSAERAYRLAVEIEPESLGVIIGLGHVLRDMGRPEESLPWYRRALKLAPNDADSHGNLGAALFEADRPVQSRRAFEQSLSLMPEHDPRAPWINLALGRVLEQLGDAEGAADAYETTLFLDPDVGVAHEALGLIAFDKGRRDEARGHFESALDLSGLRPGAVAHLALIYDEIGLADDVRRLIDLLAVARDREPQVTFHLARILVRCTAAGLRDRDRAIELLDDLVVGDLADSPAVWQLMAEALAGTGKFDDAVAAMDRAIGSADPAAPSLPEYLRLRDDYAALASGR